MHSKFYALSEHLGLLKVSGSGAQKLLQGQLSCDMESVSADNGCMAAHCNPQGRIISLFYAARVGEDYLLVMPQPLLPVAAASLKKYAPFFKAEIQDASKEFLIIGAEKDAKLSAAASITHASQQRKILLMFSCDEKSLEPYSAWELLDLLEGIPAIYPETSGKYLPHDLNLPALGAINFNKGCFTGQEIIARMQYRGKPKNHLYRGLSAIRLMPGADLYQQQKAAATVINCSQTVYNDRYVLLFTCDEATANSGTLETEDGHRIELLRSE